jgi:hypothetical protein
MKRVDRLYIQLQRAYGETDKQASLGFVDPVYKEGDYTVIEKWKATAVLWDGKTGSCKEEDYITSYHSTQEEAVKAIEAIAEKYAPTGLKKAMFEDFPILIMDCME